MKLTILFILFTCLQVSAKVGAQSISLEEHNATLAAVFKKIEKQTDYTFFYETKLLLQAKKVDLVIKGGLIDQVLQQCFKDQPFSYHIVEKTIVITQKEEVKKKEEDELILLPFDVHGIVKDESGKPIGGVTVRVKGSSKGTITNDSGEFALSGVSDNAILIFSSVNLQTFEVKVMEGKNNDISVTLKAKINDLADVSVTTVNTGYQQIPKERAAGSFVLIDSAILNRSVSANIIDRMEGVTSGLNFNKNIQLGPNSVKLQPNQSILTIRGRSTINSTADPLIVLDNFPYDGDLSTINPDDVENITVLKDAAAASIWGAFSGNGVIVITTKKGKYNQPLKVTLNANLTIANKPNLFYSPLMNSNDYVDVEQFLYSKGFYTSALTSTNRSSLSPVVEILANRAAGLITASDSATQIDGYRKIDTRSDLSKYFYQKSINQHYDITLNGGSQNNKYAFSAGFDNNQPNLTFNTYQRVNLRAGNSYLLLDQKLEISTDIQLSQSYTANNNSGSISSSLPYLQLADANGNALIVPNSGGYRKPYTDTAGQSKLLDWNYRPLDEIRNANNITKLTDYHINLSAKYKVIKGLDVSVLYNYNKGISLQENYQSQSTYLTRDLINRFTQINFVTGIVTRPVPLGGILDRSDNSYESHNIRGVVNYSHNWNNLHSLSILAGTELKEFNSFSYTNRLYGYNPDNTTYGNVDYFDQFPTYVTKSNAQITSNINNLGKTNNFISYYGLAGYTFKNTYTLTVSARRDESNLYGVSSNLKGVPLYSAGLGWDINKESFYNFKWLPFLKLRITDGYQGNNNSSTAALTTITYGSINNSYGATQASISNFPNPLLRWERVNQLNFGLDFGVKDNRIKGTIDYFIKKSTDLIAVTPVDPTSGTSTFTSNSANMETKGVDIALYSKNIVTRNFQWNTSFLFSYALDRVTAYLVKPSTIGTFLTVGLINPLAGHPLYSVYAYKWAGLDSAGNPQAVLDGKISNNYPGFASSTNYDNLRYMGPVNPSYITGLLNTITFKQLSFSFNITGKFGYYFRRQSISYSSLFLTGGGIGNPDYTLRWQKSGDEKVTNVPAMIYTGYNNGRDAVYTNSDILVEKGDHIRLKDIQFSYNLSQNQIKKLPFKSAQFYVYANNVGILWRANKYGIDPDAVPQGNNYYLLPVPRSFSIGVKLGF